MIAVFYIFIYKYLKLFLFTKILLKYDFIILISSFKDASLLKYLILIIFKISIIVYIACYKIQTNRYKYLRIWKVTRIVIVYN